MMKSIVIGIICAGVLGGIVASYLFFMKANDTTITENVMEDRESLREVESSVLVITPSGISMEMKDGWRVESTNHSRGDIKYTYHKVVDGNNDSVMGISTPFYSTSYGAGERLEDSTFLTELGEMSMFVVRFEGRDNGFAHYKWDEIAGTQGNTNSFAITVNFESYDEFIKNRSLIESVIQNIK